MNVEFSDIALAGLKRSVEESSCENYRLAIIYFLKAHDAEKYAYRLFVFPDKQMYVRPLDSIRIMYELTGFGRPTIVWSIKPLTDE